jgi:hypothetical protein
MSQPSVQHTLRYSRWRSRRSRDMRDEASFHNDGQSWEFFDA